MKTGSIRRRPAGFASYRLGANFSIQQIADDLIARIAEGPAGKKRALAVLMEFARQGAAPSGVVPCPDCAQGAALNVPRDREGRHEDCAT